MRLSAREWCIMAVVVPLAMVTDAAANSSNATNVTDAANSSNATNATNGIGGRKNGVKLPHGLLAVPEQCSVSQEYKANVLLCSGCNGTSCNSNASHQIQATLIRTQNACGTVFCGTLNKYIKNMSAGAMATEDVTGLVSCADGAYRAPASCTEGNIYMGSLKSWVTCKLVATSDATAASVNMTQVASVATASSAMSRYPSYSTAGVNVTGSVTVVQKDPSTLTLSYSLSGCAANITAGLHIHAGTTCAAVAGHYYDGNVDPWNTTYTADGNGTATGSFDIQVGTQLADVDTHAVVVHGDSTTDTSSSVACATLSCPLCASVLRSQSCQAQAACDAKRVNSGGPRWGVAFCNNFYAAVKSPYFEGAYNNMSTCADKADSTHTYCSSLLLGPKAAKVIVQTISFHGQLSAYNGTTKDLAEDANGYALGLFNVTSRNMMHLHSVTSIASAVRRVDQKLYNVTFTAITTVATGAMAAALAQNLNAAIYNAAIASVKTAGASASLIAYHVYPPTITDRTPSPSGPSPATAPDEGSTDNTAIIAIVVVVIVLVVGAAFFLFCYRSREVAEAERHEQRVTMFKGNDDEEDSGLSIHYNEPVRSMGEPVDRILKL